MDININGVCITGSASDIASVLSLITKQDRPASTPAPARTQGFPPARKPVQPLRNPEFIRGTSFTTREVALIKDHSRTAKEIAEITGRSVNSIQKKRNKMRKPFKRVPLSSGYVWSKEEDSLLTELFPLDKTKPTVQEIEEYIELFSSPYRSSKAVQLHWTHLSTIS